jgi:hypothetical protein
VVVGARRQDEKLGKGYEESEGRKEAKKKRVSPALPLCSCADILTLFISSSTPTYPTCPPNRLFSVLSVSLPTRPAYHHGALLGIAMLSLLSVGSNVAFLVFPAAVASLFTNNLIFLGLYIDRTPRDLMSKVILEETVSTPIGDNIGRGSVSR